MVGKTKHVVNKKLHCWQSKACYKQEASRLAKQSMLYTRSYTVEKTKHVVIKRLHVGKIKHVISKKLHDWQIKTCCKQEVTQLTKQSML
jgi:hypothetical protein